MRRTGASLSEGEIGSEHVGEIHKVMSQISGRIDRQLYEQTETDLVELARQANPAAVRKAGQRVMAHVDQDGKPPEDRDQTEPTRDFVFCYRRSGWMKFCGHLDPESAAQLEGLLGALAKPDPAAATGEPDRRGLDRHRGDALAEIVDLAARADDATTQGGERAAMTVTVGLEELQRRTREAIVDLPSWTSSEALRRAACQAKVIPAVLGKNGEPLDVGRASRLATSAQRHALVLRDGGSAFPGCDRTPKWTTAHHVTGWADGGVTDLHNMVLLCARHHRRIHHSDWEVAIRCGVPEFYPPGWLDPDRSPLHNRAHYPPGQPRAA